MNEEISKPRIEKLAGKIRISGQIELVTGLHIGGTKEALDIGGLNLDVIKTPHGVPYIPGSSLKGKMRAMLAMREGSIDVDMDSEIIKEIFGDSGEDAQKGLRGCLLVRDAFLREEQFRKDFDQDRLNEPFSEYKTENRIQRIAGKAEHPRTLARVPAGARFDFELMVNVQAIEDSERPETEGINAKRIRQILLALRLIEDDYLGGNGSRGYGQIKFDRQAFVVGFRSLKDYEEGRETWQPLSSYSLYETVPQS